MFDEICLLGNHFKLKKLGIAETSFSPVFDHCAGRRCQNHTGLWCSYGCDAHSTRVQVMPLEQIKLELYGKESDEGDLTQESVKPTVHQRRPIMVNQIKEKLTVQKSTGETYKLTQVPTLKPNKTATLQKEGSQPKDSRPTAVCMSKASG